MLYLFADNIILIDVTQKGVNKKLECWRHTIESRGFKLSLTKTVCLKCSFSGWEEGREEEVTICDVAVPIVEKFRLDNSGDKGYCKDISQCIKVEWQNRRVI